MALVHILMKVDELFPGFHAGEHPRLALLAIIITASSILITSRVIYLLYLHPLASFPGPRSAALSTWWLYGVSKTGRAEETFEQLHNKYRTRALRIGPNELHLSDSSLYHVIYSQRHTYTKYPFFYDAFNTPHSVFVEIDQDLHRERRKMLSTFFSKASIRKVQDNIVDKVSILSTRISEMKDKGPVSMYQAARCMTVDIISEVAFGKSFQLLIKSEDNNFGTDFLKAFDLVAESTWDFMYLPVLRLMTNILPPTISASLSKPVAHLQEVLKAVKNTVEDFKALQASDKKPEHEIVFERMTGLDNIQMHAEAMDILIAGSDTTATTIATAIEALARDPKIFNKLKVELKQTGTRKEDYDLTRLEQLPYLSACVKEALRCGMAVPGRLPRVVPSKESGAEALVIDGKVVPPGSIVAVTAYTVHHDTNIWGSDAAQFKPERWLTEDAKQLEKYLVTFSKGRRQCLGINLAYAEITLTLAMLVNRFQFIEDKTLTTADTTRSDFFTVGFKGTGIRVNIQEIPK